jgi:hypothetical protein
VDEPKSLDELYLVAQDIAVPVTTQAGVLPAEADAVRPTASYRTNLITWLLSAWFTIGLFLDAWAHNNVPELETFFTPWHAVYYTGFLATAGWLLWTCRATVRTRRWDLATIPVGYAPSLVALGGFALAAIGDLTWHEVFGIEQSIDILFSPTHLILGASMLVIVTTPLRSAWADRGVPREPGLVRLLPALGALSLATTIVLLFLQYANAYTYSGVDIVVALSGLDERRTSDLVSAIAVTNLVLLVPLLVAQRWWTLPLGAATILCLAVATLAGAVTGFDNVAVLVSLLVAGVVTDVLARLVRPFQRPRVFGAAVPLVMWTAYVAVAVATPRPMFLGPDGTSHQTDGMIELYTGVPIMQALLGLLVACSGLVWAERPHGHEVGQAEV